MSRYLDGGDVYVVMGAVRAAPAAVRASPSSGIIARTAPSAGGSAGGSTGGLGLPPVGKFPSTGRLDLSSGRYASPTKPPPAATTPTAPAPKIAITNTRPTASTGTPGVVPPASELPAQTPAAPAAAAPAATAPADVFAPSGGGGGGASPFDDPGSDPYAEFMDASEYGDPYGGELAAAEAAFDYAEAPRRRREVEEPLDFGAGGDGGEVYFEDEYLEPGQAQEMLGSYVHGSDVLGADVVAGVDTQGLIQRFGEIAHTNNMARRIWVEHGFPLAQRVTKAAQDLLNKAVVPLNEFEFHDSVIAFAKRADSVGSKISPLPLDEQPCPYWDELERYVLDGAYLVNALEGTLGGSVKWTDVKDSAMSFATGIKDAANRIDSTFKWTTGLLVGGSVLLGSAVIYGLYKLLSGPTGQAAAHGLGSAAGRRLMG